MNFSENRWLRLLTSIIFDFLREIAPQKVGLKRCVNTATSASLYLMFIYSFHFLRFPSINITHQLCQLKWIILLIEKLIFRELDSILGVIRRHLTLTNKFSVLSAFWLIASLRRNEFWIYLRRALFALCFFRNLTDGRESFQLTES